MGLYEDLNEDILEAFDTDLLDATRIIQYATETSIYDPDKMINVLKEIKIDVRAVKIKSELEEQIDEPSFINKVSFLVMDYDRVKAGIDFEIGIKIIDDKDQYKIEYLDQDPAKASTILKCRRWG